MPKSNSEYCKTINTIHTILKHKDEDVIKVDKLKTIIKDIHDDIREQMNGAHYEIRLVDEKTKEIANDIKSIMIRRAEDIHSIIDYWE